MPYQWWTRLALVFVYLSLDEALSFHERLNRPVRDLLDTSGALYYAWVIPYALFALGLLFILVTLFLPRGLAGLWHSRKKKP